jgi:hypothetical protein
MQVNCLHLRLCGTRVCNCGPSAGPVSKGKWNSGERSIDKVTALIRFKLSNHIKCDLSCPNSIHPHHVHNVTMLMYAPHRNHICHTTVGFFMDL